MVIYRVLGELAIQGQGQRPTIPNGNTRRVLIALMLNPAKPVAKEALIKAGWGEAGVDEAQLHKAINTIRSKLLQPVGRHGDLRTEHRKGYTFAPSADAFDLLVFERLVREAEAAGVAGRDDQELELLREALRLWQGPAPLSPRTPETDDDFAGFVADIDALWQRRKRATMRRCALELALGRHDLVLGDLATLVAQEPTDGGPIELYLIALFRAGDTTRAAEILDQHRAALAEAEEGRPRDTTRNLAYAVSGGDAATVAEHEERLGVARRQAQATAAVPRELPIAPEGLVGRDGLTDEASWLLRRRGGGPNVLVVSGPPGIGKSALAVSIAHKVVDEFPDGQLYVELRGVSDPVETPVALAQLLQSLGAPVPVTRAERVARYRTLLANRRVLLVLDDARDEAQVVDLLPSNPECGVLISSREKLPDLPRVHHLAKLETLSNEDATRLFLWAVRRGDVPEPDDEEAVAAIVALCGGLPLALRICAALTVQQAGRPMRELVDDLRRHGTRAFTYRDQSVAAAIGASVARLDDGARLLFLGLGLLRLPDFGLWTAAAILDGTGFDPGLALARLVAAYLVQPVQTGAGTDGLPRYQFHDLTRDYASREAEQRLAGDLTRIPEQVLRALLTLTRRAQRTLVGGDFEVVHSEIPDCDIPAPALAEVDRSGYAWFAAERRNLRAAISQAAELGLADACWDLAISAHEYYGIALHTDDWFTTSTIALQACREAGNRRGEAAMLTSLGQPGLVAGRPSGTVSGVDELERAVALFTEAGDQHGRAIALRTLGNCLRRRGQLARPLALFQESLPLYESAGDLMGVRQVLRYIAQTYLDQGELSHALEFLVRARDADSGGAGWQGTAAQVSYWAGMVQLELDRVEAAEKEFAEVVRLAPEGLGSAYAEHGMGETARRRGDLAEAVARLQRAARLAQEAPDAGLEGRVSLSLAAVYQQLGDWDAQLRELEKAVRCFADGGWIPRQAAALAALAKAHEEHGDVSVTAGIWNRIRELYDGVDVPAQDRVYLPLAATGAGSGRGAESTDRTAAGEG